MGKTRFHVLMVAALAVALAISVTINLTGETKAQVFSKNFSSLLKESVGDTLTCWMESQDRSMAQINGSKAVLQEVGSDFVRFGVLLEGKPFVRIVVPTNSITRLMSLPLKGKMVLFNLKFASGEFMK